LPVPAAAVQQCTWEAVVTPIRFWKLTMTCSVWAAVSMITTALPVPGDGPTASPKFDKLETYVMGAAPAELARLKAATAATTSLFIEIS
jgi:hypothetical protein